MQSHITLLSLVIPLFASVVTTTYRLQESPSRAIPLAIQQQISPRLELELQPQSRLLPRTSSEPPSITDQSWQPFSTPQSGGSREKSLNPYLVGMLATLRGDIAPQHAPPRRSPRNPTPMRPLAEPAISGSASGQTYSSKSWSPGDRDMATNADSSERKTEKRREYKRNRHQTHKTEGNAKARERHKRIPDQKNALKEKSGGNDRQELNNGRNPPLEWQKVQGADSSKNHGRLMRDGVHHESRHPPKSSDRSSDLLPNRPLRWGSQQTRTYTYRGVSYPAQQRKIQD